MKFMILVKATKDSEAANMPAEKKFAEMAAYHEQLEQAGVLVDMAGRLKPTSEGWRIRYHGKTRSVVEGPFIETKDLVAAFTIIDVGSREEALEWSKKYPNPSNDGGVTEIEVRPFYELEDLPQSKALERFREMHELEQTTA
jgi:hypothetical protein